MAATTGSLFDTHSERIEEIINKSVDVILPTMDPFWSGMVTTSQGVGSMDAIGRDMEIIKVFQGGLTGVVDAVSDANDYVLYGDPETLLGTPRLHTQTTSSTWPDPDAGPNQTPYRLKVPMRAIRTNIKFTLGELQAEALPAFIGQVIGPKLVGLGQNISQMVCNYWYMSQNKSFALSDVGDYTDWTFSTEGAGTTHSPTVYTFTFKPNEENFDRYMPGMLVDIYSSNGNIKRNYNDGVNDYLCYVLRVDELAGTVTLVSQTYQFTGDSSGGSTTSSAGDPDASGNLDIEQTDIVVYRNSKSSTSPYFMGIAGVNSWMKDGSDGTLTGTPAAGTGTDLYLLGAEADSTDRIDVSVYPEHKSMLYNMAGDPLTEHMLRRILRRFHAAKRRYGQTIDCLVASEGVWLAYEATRMGREWVDRSGRIGGTAPQGFNSDENFGGFTFTMDGKKYMGYTSTYIEDGVVYGFKKGGNNWKRYVPPDYAGLNTFNKVKPGVPFRFIAQALGSPSNKFPIFHTSSGNAGAKNLVTEAVQMPGMLRQQLVPDQPAGLKIINAATDKVYSAF